MALTGYENTLRTIRMTNPEWMPYRISIGKSTWIELKENLEDVLAKHPRTWPAFKKGTKEWGNITFLPHENPDCGDFIDSWGCVWRTHIKGNVGSVIKPVLEDITKLNEFVPPNPENCMHMYPINWEEVKKGIEEIKLRGQMAIKGIDHGFHLLRLQYLRGFENLMCDLVMETPEIKKLVEMVHNFNKKLVQRCIEAGAKQVSLPEDLGTQQSSLLGPKLFRRWVTPFYKELYHIAHRAGCLTYMHTDGNIMDVADQIIEIGPDTLNPQDLVNGIENLRKAFKGRFCIDLDFDRQHIIPFGTRKEIEELIEMEVKTLGSSKGGLKVKADM